MDNLMLEKRSEVMTPIRSSGGRWWYENAKCGRARLWPKRCGFFGTTRGVSRKTAPWAILQIFKFQADCTEDWSRKFVQLR